MTTFDFEAITLCDFSNHHIWCYSIPAQICSCEFERQMRITSDHYSCLQSQTSLDVNWLLDRPLVRMLSQSCRKQKQEPVSLIVALSHNVQCQRSTFMPAFNLHRTLCLTWFCLAADCYHVYVRCSGLARSLFLNVSVALSCENPSDYNRNPPDAGTLRDLCMTCQWHPFKFQWRFLDKTMILKGFHLFGSVSLCCDSLFKYSSSRASWWPLHMEMSPCAKRWPSTCLCFHQHVGELGRSFCKAPWHLDKSTSREPRG